MARFAPLTTPTAVAALYTASTLGWPTSPGRLFTTTGLTF
jgi:hypothetical protein